MKKQRFAILIFMSILVLAALACTKNNEDLRTSGRLQTLQNKWLLNSVRAYPTRDFSGNDYIGFDGNGKDYYNFGIDGKIYSYTLGIYDTTGYKLMPNDSTLLLYKIFKGVNAEIPDTATIIAISADSLVWWHKNPYGDYGRFSFRK